MNKGESRTVNKFLKYIDPSDMENVNEYVLNSIVKDYQRCSSEFEVRTTFSVPSYVTYDDASYIRRLTGTNYSNINSALRDRWNYAENGNESQKEEFLKTATKIKSIISANPVSFGDFVCYRGVDLSYFKDYGIESLEELSSLSGKFMLDKGFVSTSILKEASFFGKEIEKGKKNNILIEYMVPSDFTDGIYIGDNSNFSYHPDEHEYVINTCNLSKVTSVRMDEENNVVISAVMIPKLLYDNYYKNKESNQK